MNNIAPPFMRQTVLDLEESRIREVTNAGMGRPDVLAFWFGESDEVTPDVVRQAAIDAGKQEIAIARKGLTEADKPAFKEIAAMGVTVTHLTPAERDAFVQITRPVYEKWKNTVGVALVKEAEEAIAARKK